MKHLIVYPLNKAQDFTSSSGAIENIPSNVPLSYFAGSKAASRQKELTIMLAISTQTPDLGIRTLMMLTPPPQFPHHQPVRRMSTSWPHISQLLSLTLSLKTFPLESLGHLGLLSTSCLDSLLGAWRKYCTFLHHNLVWEEWLCYVGLGGPEFDSATRLRLRWEVFSVSNAVPDIGIQWSWCQWHWWWDYQDNLTCISHRLA